MAHTPLGDRAFVGMQYLLPQQLLSRAMHWLARLRIGIVRNLAIRAFMRFYPVNLAEAEHAEPADYGSFNEFFTRRLKPGARRVDPAPDAVVSPVDGGVSQAGALNAGQLLQAKGIGYGAGALLAGDADLAAQFDDGAFATLYLAPWHYHRIHMPLAGTLRSARYVPGDLFSVNSVTAASVPGLFARNERIVCHFDTVAGPMAVVLVGALFVGSMSLSWAGEVNAVRRRRIVELPAHDPIIALDKGAELGCFNMGSTVILLFARDRVRLLPGLEPGRAVRMGERLATLA